MFYAMTGFSVVAMCPFVKIDSLQNNEARGLTPANLMTYCEATVLSTVWYWQENRQMDHQDRAESQKQTHIESQLIFDKGATVTQ
jgi:hypothetical protein